MRTLKRHPIYGIVNMFLVDSPLPSNISYMWNMGSMAGIMLMVQVVTGIILAMHYGPNVDIAFASVEHICRDVNYGWLIRYVHANGASVFFIVVYLHMGRGMYNGSYKKPREMVWTIGVIIFLVMIGTAFMGYVLPWGQMSLWAATVITNFVSAIPWIGKDIVEYIWGGYAVDNPTLNRFYAVHFVLPFMLMGLVGGHFIALHQSGSSNQVGVESNMDKLRFHPYFTVKDGVGFGVMFMGYSGLIYFYPDILGHPDNYVMANPLVTPTHIVPEWYFLPLYAILRSVPDKLGGVIVMIGAIVILIGMPILDTGEIRTKMFRPISKKAYWFFVGDVILLGWLGGQPVEDPYVMVGQMGTMGYFGYIIVVNPVLGVIENVIGRMGGLGIAERKTQ